MFQQVKFIDNEGEIHGGIAKINCETDKMEYVICGCCGGLFEMDEIKIVRVYNWIDLDEIILGDD